MAATKRNLVKAVGTSQSRKTFVISTAPDTERSTTAYTKAIAARHRAAAADRRFTAAGFGYTAAASRCTTAISRPTRASSRSTPKGKRTRRTSGNSATSKRLSNFCFHFALTKINKMVTNNYV